MRVLNLDTIHEAIPLIGSLAGLPKKQLQDWRLGKDINGEPLECVVTAATLRKSGLPEIFLNMDYASRYFVMGLVPAEAKGTGIAQKSGRNNAIPTPELPLDPVGLP